METLPPSLCVGAHRLTLRPLPPGCLLAGQMATFKMPLFTDAYQLRPHACCALEKGLSGVEDAVIVNSIVEGTGSFEQGKTL